MNCHALVVDDDAGCRTVSADEMQRLGYTVDRAECGEAALACAARHWPDLVLMDVRMPGIDGVETLARLRAQPGGPGLRVIVMTASVMPSDLMRLERVGYDELLRKPMSPRRLRALAARLMDAQRPTTGPPQDP